MSGLTKTMHALHLSERQIASMKEVLQNKSGRIEIGGSASGIERVFEVRDLVAAGFEEVSGM